MARNLFTVRGVDQLTFFENFITVTKFNYEDWENIEDDLIRIIKEEMPKHDPNYYDPDPEAKDGRAFSGTSKN